MTKMIKYKYKVMWKKLNCMYWIKQNRRLSKYKNIHYKNIAQELTDSNIMMI